MRYDACPAIRALPDGQTTAVIPLPFDDNVRRLVSSVPFGQLPRCDCRLRQTSCGDVIETMGRPQRLFSNRWPYVVTVSVALMQNDAVALAGGTVASTAATLRVMVDRATALLRR